MSSAAMTLPGDAQARRDISSLCISTLANICEALAMYLPCAWQWLYSAVATGQKYNAGEPKAVMWRCHQVEVVSVTNGRSDWRRHMAALPEVALPLKRRRVVHFCKGCTQPLQLTGATGSTNCRKVTMCLCDKAQRLTGAHGHAAGHSVPARCASEP